MPATPQADERKPKTEFDERFIAVARQVMQSRGIKSDRAVSIALGKHPDFINRIRRGLQSAPPDAWDTLFDKYPEARNITTNTTTQSGDHSIGNVEGDTNYTMHVTPEEMRLVVQQVLNSQATADTKVVRSQTAAKEIRDLRDHLVSKSALIASRDEILSLLRGGYN